MEKAGEKYLDLSFKKIRNMIEIDMDMKIEDDAKALLKRITHELFEKHAFASNGTDASSHVRGDDSATHTNMFKIPRWSFGD